MREKNQQVVLVLQTEQQKERAQLAESTPPRSVYIHSAHRPIMDIREPVLASQWLSAGREDGQMGRGQPMAVAEEKNQADEMSMWTCFTAEEMRAHGSRAFRVLAFSVPLRSCKS